MKRTRQELADHYGVALRTITNWLQAGCPRTTEQGQPRFLVEQVDAWLDAHGRRPRPQTAPAADTMPSLGSGTARDAAARADAVKKIAQARHQEHELQQERGLRDLDLADRIKTARTADEIVELALEVAGLVAKGSMKHQRAQALRQLLGQVHRALRERQARQDQDGRLFLLSREAREVAEAFDNLANGWRRRWLAQATLAHLAEDERELPGWDGDMRAVLAGLQIDTMGEPTGGAWPDYLPPPAVPPARVISPTPYADEVTS